MDKEGFPIRSTMTAEETIEYTGLTSQLLEYMERELAQCEIRVLILCEISREDVTENLGADSVCKDEVKEA